MVGITSVNKQFKSIQIILTIIDFIVLIFCLYRMITINYANIYQYDRVTGIEHLPLYFFLAIALFIIFIISVGIILFWKEWNNKIIIPYAIFVILIIISIIAGLKLPIVNEYTSSSYNQEQSEFLPIDKFEYKEDSEDYYFYRDVTIGDIYWIGSSSYKDFATENRTVEWTEEPQDSTVYLNYYYLFDESGHLVKNYLNKKNWYDILSVSYYESEQKIDNYVIYEYEDCYELILEDDKEIFYLSASKNKRTQYDENDLIVIANELTGKLRRIQD